MLEENRKQEEKQHKIVNQIGKEIRGTAKGIGVVSTKAQVLSSNLQTKASGTQEWNRFQASEPDF